MTSKSTDNTPDNHKNVLNKTGIPVSYSVNEQALSPLLSCFIIENSNNGTIVINERFECIYANKEMANIVGLPVQKIIGSDFREFLPEESRDIVIDRYMRRQKGEVLPGRYEVDFCRKDGGRRIADINVNVMITQDRQILTIVQAFDVSGRKCMKEEIEKSEKKYRDFFENVLDFIFIHDLEDNLIENNVRYVTEVGARPDVIATSNLRDLIPEKFKPEFDDYLNRIKNKGRDEGVIAIQVPEGEIRILEYRNLLIYDDDNRPVSVLGSARDITEHIRDKKALRESKQRYQMILENVGDYIYELDLAGNYTFVNEALVKRSGYSREELIGMNYRDYIFPEEKEIIEAYHYQIFNTGKTGKGLEHRVIRKDGSPVFIELVASLIKNENGNPIGFRGVARDVTERRLAEKVLKESEQQLKEIIEGTPIPTIVFNKNQHITHWNRACEELTGVKAIDVIGQGKQVAEKFFNQPILPDFLVKNVSLNDISAFYGSECRKSKIVKNAFEVESFFSQLGEKGKWLFLTMAFLRDPENKIIGVIETLLDVTSQKRAEKKLLKMHDALEEKVVERTKELQEVNIALEVLLKKRENDKKKFEDKVAYSIKEILSPHLELLKKTHLDKHQKVYLEILEDNFREISSPFMTMLSDKIQKLTRTEIQVINLIKQNKITKEIADLMGISTRTVETHRDNIRRKLGIKNKKVNLRSFLMSSE